MFNSFMKACFNEGAWFIETIRWAPCPIDAA